MGYRIKTVSDLTGIPRNTLLSWERRFQVLKPQRGGNRYRTYSESDVASVRRLKGHLDRGLKISEAVEQLRRGPAEPAPVEQQRGPETREQLKQALLRYDRGEAERVLLRLLGVPYLYLICEVFFPILAEIGAGWAAGRLSVAQEHFASAFLRDHLAAMLLRTGGGPAHGRHAVCATLPEEKHEIALLGLAVHLAMSGCRVTYLGPELPLGELRQHAAQSRPACVYLSVIKPLTRVQVMDTAAELRAGIAADTGIVIGGSGLPEGLPVVPGVRLLRDWRSVDLT